MFHSLTVNNSSFGWASVDWPVLIDAFSSLFLSRKLSSTGDKIWSDDQCMKKIAQGHEEPFQQLFSRYGDLVFGYCMKLLKDRERAEDASQDVWIKVIKNADKYKGQGKLRAWLLQITRNTCFSLFRDIKKNKSEDVEDHEIEDVNQSDILDLMSDQETKVKLKACIEELPDQQRIVLIVWMTEDKSYEEIASHMNLTVSSVKSLLFRSRQKLKEMMN